MRIHVETWETIEDTAGQDSPLRCLSPRVKLLSALALIVSLVSLGPHEVVRQTPFALLLGLIMVWGKISAAPLLKRAALALPFAVSLTALNPWLDTQHGCMSIVSVSLKALLTTAFALLLAASTPLAEICRELERFGAPRAFSQQLLFLWRYASVLSDEAKRMTQARELRAFSKALRPRLAARLIGALLSRSLVRAERLHQAMCCRLYREGV